VSTFEPCSSGYFSGQKSTHLFWSLLKIPYMRYLGRVDGKIIWLKRLKSAPALDFPYFQRVSKLVMQDIRNPVFTRLCGFVVLGYLYALTAKSGTLAGLSAVLLSLLCL